MDQLTKTIYFQPDHVKFLEDLGWPSPGGRTVPVQEGTIASYGPGGYAIYSPVIAIGRLIGLGLLPLIYLARLAGVAAYALIVALAVKRLPLHRWIMVGCALIPEALNQASTVSADGLTIVLTLLLVAVSLRLSLDVSAPRRSLLVEAGVASGLLALGKPPYVVFVLFLLIPLWRYRGKLIAPVASVIGGSALLSVLWITYQRSHSMRLDLPGLFPLQSAKSNYAYRDIHISAQTTYVVHQPLAFVATVWHTFLFQGSAFPLQMFGLLSDYQVPTIIVLLSAVVVGVSCAVPEPVTGFVLPKLERIGLVGLSLIIGLGIMAVVYTNTNALHAPRIDQLTPRYMLPLLPPLLIGVLPSRLRMRSWSPALGAGVGAGSALVLLLVVIGLQGFQFA